MWDAHFFGMIFPDDWAMLHATVWRWREIRFNNSTHNTRRVSRRVLPAWGQAHIIYRVVGFLACLLWQNGPCTCVKEPRPRAQN